MRLTRRTLGRTLACAVLSAACLRPALAQHADLEPAPDPAAPGVEINRRYLMEDAYGNARSNDEFLGRFVLIYFGYTGCPDVCPTTLSTLAEALDDLGAAAEQVVALFVTVDPQRDTAKLLQDYTAMFDDRIVALRGPQAYTDHMVKAFNARYERHIPDPAHPEHYSIDHTASVALVGPDGTLIKRYPHGTTGAEMAADLGQMIAAEGASGQ